MLFVSITTKLWTLWKRQEEINETNTVRNNVNNLAYNKELVSAAVEVLMALAASVIGLALSGEIRSNPKDQPETSLAQLLLLDLGHSFACMVVGPSIVYIANSDIRTHFLEFYSFK